MFQNGRRFDGKHLQMLCLPAEGAAGRVGYVIGRKQLGSAVDRNLLRRILREAIRRRRPAIDAFDVVVRLRRACPPASVRDLAVEASTLLDQLTVSRP